MSDYLPRAAKMSRAPLGLAMLWKCRTLTEGVYRVSGGHGGGEYEYEINTSTKLDGDRCLLTARC